MELAIITERDISGERSKANRVLVEWVDEQNRPRGNIFYRRETGRGPLVEQKTCRMEYKKDKFSVACSNCGEEMSIYTCDWEGTALDRYSYPYCYNCGAKVVN